MLARALKVLDYPPNSSYRHGIDTAALDQPGDEASAYGRAGQKWQPLNRTEPCGDEAFAWAQAATRGSSEMAISVRSTAFSADFLSRAARWMVTAALLLAIAAPVPTEAR